MRIRKGSLVAICALAGMILAMQPMMAPAGANGDREASLTGLGNLDDSDVLTVGPDEWLLWRDLFARGPAVVEYKAPDGSCLNSFASHTSGEGLQDGEARGIHFEALGPCTFEATAYEEKDGQRSTKAPTGYQFPTTNPYCRMPSSSCFRALAEQRAARAPSGPENESIGYGIFVDPDPCDVASNIADSWIWTGSASNPLTRTYVSINYCYDFNEVKLKTTPPQSHCLDVDPWDRDPCFGVVYNAGPSTDYVDAQKGGWFERPSENQQEIEEYGDELVHYLLAYIVAVPNGKFACEHLLEGEDPPYSETAEYDGTYDERCEG